MQINKLFPFLYLILIIYLVVNTGIFSDEFGTLIETKNKNIEYILIPKGDFYYINTPLLYLSHYLVYRFSNINNLFLIELFKIIYILLAFFLIVCFFRIYLDIYTAFWASFLFLFFPSHDSTTYFFMGQYLTLSLALYLYSFYLAHNNKLTLAFLLGLIASFLSYGSPPLAVALFILFALNKEFKKGAVIIIPNIIYALYFIPLNIVMRIGSPRIIEKLSISAAIKQFVLQKLTFIDAMFGPSMWLKIYYSFGQLSVMSFIIGVIFLIIFYRIKQEGSSRYNPKLVISFTVLLFLSFFMFAVTGRYPQLAFNLGNRTTIFGSLLLTYLIVLIPAPKKIKTLIFSLFIFAILGISDHWKNWNLHQREVIANIKKNPQLNTYQENRIIYVCGNQYSKYGPISHIEFFSEDWVPNAIFKIVLGKEISAVSLGKRHKYIDGYLVDTKYNKKREVSDYINIYDSEKNKFFKLNAVEINNYIDSLPDDNRHWIQLCNNRLIKNIIIKLMPRLNYLF